jgi:hypothetical protein
MQLSVVGRQTKAVDLGLVTLAFSASLAHSLVDGTAAGQADRVFTDERTLDASATEDLDLSGVLLDAFGAAILFASIKAIVVIADPDNTNNVNVTRPGAAGVPLFLAAGDGMPIRPGYGFAWFGSGAGVAVTAASADLLTFTNSGAGTPVTYKIVIIGTSA